MVLPEDTYLKTVTWTSSNRNVATVASNGVVTAVSPGTATITAASTADPDKTASVSVTVKNEWGDWSSWSTSQVSATSDRQVETRLEYQSRTITFGGWSEWENNRRSDYAS